MIILAGLAGGLQKNIQTGDAYFISQVKDLNTGRYWESSVAPSPCILVSTTNIATTPESKHSLLQATGADLVDLESAAFAEAATEYGWNWAITRGISDGPEDALPECIAEWTDESGHLKFASIIRDITLGRSTIPEMIRLRRNGSEALRAVATIIRNWIVNR